MHLQAKIDELNANMPKKIVKRMEENERLRREKEMTIDDDENRTAKCTIS
jgi:hypothetical protein